MPKKNKKQQSGRGPAAHKLPPNALAKVALGQSFAEYDKQLLEPGIFVETLAFRAAQAPERGRCFFVGRRGTGKTATTLALQAKLKNTLLLTPLVFIPSDTPVSLAQLKDTRNRYFKSLVYCYRRALLGEVLRHWQERKLMVAQHLPEELAREYAQVEKHEFDVRLMQLFKEVFRTLHPTPSDSDWMKLIRRESSLSREMKRHAEGSDGEFVVLIDRLDECWDGSDLAVVYLMALMHACVQLASEGHCIRPMLFLRENIFERVRQLDNEFARLETGVVSLEWTREQLLELVERRLRAHLSTKPGLNGDTWALFFEDDPDRPSQDSVFDFCQGRPRDVLMYVDLALQTALSHSHSVVTTGDLVEARRTFSDSRLKDLEDEYSENLPYIPLVLRRFYSLGRQFSVSGIEAFLQRLLRSKDVTQYCKDWIFDYSEPERFIELLYGIGFFGIVGKNGVPKFRSVGVKQSHGLTVTKDTQAIVHPAFSDALNLQELFIHDLDEEFELRQDGLVDTVPGAMSAPEYIARLTDLEEDLKTLPTGRSAALQFENAVGEVIKLCLSHALTNVEEKSRTSHGIIVRDWIASNRARIGFWSLIRQKFGADQVIWECKNYETLKAEDFHQALYYASGSTSKFVVMVFRGERKPAYRDHVRHVHKGGGFVLLLNVKDLLVFVRQARRGVFKDTHIYERYDAEIRAMG